MEKLPVELLENIFHELSSLRDIQNAFNTCSKWRNIIKSMFKDKAKILIVSRSPSDYLEIELIDLIEPKLNFKFEVEGRASIKGAVGGFIQNKPMICGGLNNNSEVQNCLVLGENFEFSLNTDRFKASSIVLKQQECLWVTGGRTIFGNQFCNANGLCSTEFVTSNPPNTVQGPKLPFTIFGHTMVQVDSKLILIIGGCQNGEVSNKTWFVDLSNDFEIKEGPPLIFARAGHSCSRMRINGKLFIVVTSPKVWSSSSDHFGKITTSSIGEHVEILDSTALGQGWMIGPSFPINVSGYTMISSPNKKSILLIGIEALRGSIMLMEMSGDSQTNLKWTIVDEGLKDSRIGPYSTVNFWSDVAFPISSQGFEFDELRKKFLN